MLFPSDGLETQRLKLQLIDESFAEDIFRELTSDVAKYMSTPLPNKVEDTINRIRSTIQKINNGEEIVVVWIDKISNEFIGIRWLHKISSGHPEPWLWTKKQNSLWKGWIGKEWLIEFIDWVQKNLEFDYLTFYIDENNKPSQKLGAAIWWIADIDEEGNKIILKSATSLGNELNLVKYKLAKKA